MGLGIGCLVYAVAAAFYVLTPFWKSDSAGIYVPGPPWVRRAIIGALGIVALAFGIVALVGY